MQTKTGPFSFVARRASLLLLAGGVLWAATVRADNHTLVAHFAFDTTDAQNDVIGTDSSGNGNDITFGAGGGGGGVFITAEAAAGPLAIQFSAGPDDDGLGVLSWSPPPAQLLSAMAGSFTVSCWIKTTQIFAAEGDAAWEGAGIVTGDVAGTANDYVPIALTGGEIAFTTGGPTGDDTLSSIDDSVNDGNYHLITVSRNQSTGEKKIYIDGMLDNTGYGVTNLLTDTQQIDIGSLGSGGDPNPGDYGFYNQYVGDLDDLQFYSGVLNATEVAYLYNNPGSNAPNIGSTPITPNLVAHYAFDNSTNIGADTSGNGYDLDFNSTAGGGSGVAFSASAQAGAGAAFFDGGSFLSYSNAPASVLSALGSSFTLSVWISTSTTSGSDGDPAWADAGIVAADMPGGARDIVPMALTGGGIGINTGDDQTHGSAGESTLDSDIDVVDGTYHHVVVTRDEGTGVRQIYIDGNLDVTDTATTYYLRDPVEVGVGARIDASQADPNNADEGGPYFQGLLDDMQLYNRVLTPAEITYLYQNPGNIVTSPAPDLVDVSVEVSIYREENDLYGEYYIAFPFLNSVSPYPTGTNMDFIYSPYRSYGGSLTGAGSDDTGALSDLVNEFTNSYWTLVINQGATNEQIFHFQASLSGLTTDLLQPVQILVPTNGATNVALNTPFQWSGPANFDYINLNDQDNYGHNTSDNLDPSATNWPSPPQLFIGTNTFDIVYTSNGFPGLTFTTPIDTLQTPIDSWTPGTDVNSEASSLFVVGGPLLPVNLVGVAPVAGGIQFSFTSQAGTSNIIQANTNLACTNGWINVTNFIGDGNVWQFVFPTTTPPTQFFRVETY
jgi:hypothetical protein